MQHARPGRSGRHVPIVSFVQCQRRHRPFIGLHSGSRTWSQVSYSLADAVDGNKTCSCSFGANHDGPTNGCEPLSGDRQHVMAPQLSSEAGPIVWSNCSRRDITRFLDRNWGTCLEDPPSDHGFHYPELPPGVMYNVDHQCRLQYGPEAVHCAGMDDVSRRVVHQCRVWSFYRPHTISPGVPNSLV
jgi:Reprolysin (M12B) family zinc metalloprotease